MGLLCSWETEGNYLRGQVPGAALLASNYRAAKALFLCSFLFSFLKPLLSCCQTLALSPRAPF